MYVLLGLTVLSTMGIDVTSIVALASVLTLALSLALQNMVSNVIGGFTILYTHPFHSGDYVEIAGQGGTVKEINMTYTMLATADNKMISIPNSAVIAAQIVNYSTAETRRVEINVTASYDAPAQKVIDTLLVTADHKAILADPAPFAALTSYGDSAISYTLRFWVKNADYWDAYFYVNQNIKTAFDENGIDWQMCELGRCDLGGGGTVAKFMANHNIDTVDLGVGVLSMHAPYELISKVDLYEGYRAFVAFYRF